jgi:hypothetical protein
MGNIDNFHQPKNECKSSSDEKKHHAEGQTIEGLDNPEGH